MKVIFEVISCLLGMHLAFLAYLFVFAFKNPGKNVAVLTRSPKLYALIIGAIVLAWSAYAGGDMLEGDLAKFRPLAYALAPITLVLCYFFLDFLNARSFGGLLVLCANHLIISGFAFAVPARPLFSTACLLLGIVGLIGIGTPWHYRNALAACSKKKPLAYGMAGAFGIIALILIFLPFFSQH